MKSVMSHNFSQVPAPEIQRSSFDRSCGHKTTFNPAFLIPFFIDEILPGDTMKFTATLLARLSTMIFPIMDNIFLDVFFFFVPNRLLWDNWERFNGAQTNPGDSTDYLIPTLTGIGFDPINFAEQSIGDYFGLPTNVNIVTVDFPNALPFRAYNLIWNEWFRDQNLQNSTQVLRDNGPDPVGDYEILKRGKRHDYFTSCLPWPQKGDSVALPLGTSAPVMGDGKALGLWDGGNQFGLFSGIPSALATDTMLLAGAAFSGTAVGVDSTGEFNDGAQKTIGVDIDPNVSGLTADLSAATAATINQLRQAFQFQKILERDARGGTRYVELLKAHFGVTSPDFRLQRPEYLGGCSQRMNVAAVQQTSQTDITPQGNLSAYTVSHAQCKFNKSFVEHGYVLGLVNVRSDITYQGGMHKMWSRKTRFDFYLPALAHLGEQAVLNKELLYEDNGVIAGDVFGYQERWAEYRYKPSFVTGAFRSNSAAPLDAWHLALDFAGIVPNFNADFIQDAPPIDRVVAVDSSVSPNIILDSYFSIRHTRPMPTYSVPGQIDRF